MSFRLVYLPKPITLIIRNGSSNCFALSVRATDPARVSVFRRATARPASSPRAATKRLRYIISYALPADAISAILFSSRLASQLRYYIRIYVYTRRVLLLLYERVVLLSRSLCRRRRRRRLSYIILYHIIHTEFAVLRG